MEITVMLLALAASGFSVRLVGLDPPAAERWADTTVTYYLQQAGSDDLTPAAALAAVRAGFASWQDVPCAELGFVELGDAPDPSTNMAVGARPNGKNEIHWVEDERWRFGAFVLGVTVPRLDSDGHLLEADIAFNGLLVQWTTAGNGGTDLESVAVHEIGHFIGLQHNLGPYPVHDPPTMAPWVAAGIQNRTLAADDAAAACFLYPREATRCASDADCPYLLGQTEDGADYYAGRLRCGEDATCSRLERLLPGAVGFGERCGGPSACREGLGCHPLGDDALCTEGCDPLAAAPCPEGYGCEALAPPLEVLGVCLPVDGVVFGPGEGPEGCRDASICGPGEACLPTPADPALRRCASFCAVAAPDCPPGERCHGYGGPGGGCFPEAAFPAELVEPTPEPGPEPTPELEPESEPTPAHEVEPSPEPEPAPNRDPGCAFSHHPWLALALLALRRRHG